MTSATLKSCGVHTPTAAASPRKLENAPCCSRFSYRIIKRVIDIVFSLAGLVILAPLLLGAAIAIKLSSPGPVFYKWRVVGRCGENFTGYKFRTMVVDAEERKKYLLQFNERKGPTFKMLNDPRVTRTGHLLRKYSIDEFPQLWSVLKGDMSLVGPRPVGLEEWQQFGPFERRKLTVTPGAICLWHVGGQPREFRDWIRQDLDYIDRWSLGLDMRVMAAGILYILSGKNC